MQSKLILRAKLRHSATLLYSKYYDMIQVPFPSTSAACYSTSSWAFTEDGRILPNNGQKAPNFSHSKKSLKQGPPHTLVVFIHTIGIHGIFVLILVIIIVVGVIGQVLEADVDYCGDMWVDFFWTPGNTNRGLRRVMLFSMSSVQLDSLYILSQTYTSRQYLNGKSLHMFLCPAVHTAATEILNLIKSK